MSTVSILYLFYYHEVHEESEEKIISDLSNKAIDGVIETYTTVNKTYKSKYKILFKYFMLFMLFMLFMVNTMTLPCFST